ncbi:MAG: GGDEF domain-containing protein [Ruminococcaceae bacterium]|nr:GGDEF domain-containing protein [Oscillospiraceae bacterium]
MKRFDFFKRIAFILPALICALFLIFFIYMYHNETLSVYRSEPIFGYSVFSDMNMELSDDSSAPAGVRKIYRGILPTDLSQEDYLCFNIAHHNIEIYFNDELVYSLSGAETNVIAKNVGSNWCIVHMGQNHAGKEVTVVLTPLFEAAISKTPEFLLGSPYTVAIEVITGELPLLIISSLCVLLGIFFVSVFLYFRFILKTDNNETIYLGLFAISIGLWKLTDLRCMSLLMPERALGLGYISIGALFLTGICLLPYFSTLFVNGKNSALPLLSLVGSLVCLTVLAMQLFGVTEIRQNLIYSHILLIISILSVPVTLLINRIVYKNWELKKSWKLLLLLGIGIAVDLIFYYRNNKNGLLSFSIMGLIIYTLIIFLKSVQDTTRKAYTDSGTGLVNRARWIELMNKDISASKPCAVLMIDMNGLKQVNDTLGHDAGDKMIFNLSDILRKTLPRTSVICRWGGDEFTVLLTDVNRERLDLEIRNIFAESEKYNAENPDLPIHFAIGAALSSEHPDCSRMKLFHLADQEMYRNKKEWYSLQQPQE